MKKALTIIACSMLVVLLTACAALEKEVSQEPPVSAQTNELISTPKPTPEPTPVPTPTLSPYRLGTPFMVNNISYTLSFVDDVEMSAFGNVTFRCNVDVLQETDQQGIMTFSPADTSLKFVTVVVDIINNSEIVFDPLSLLTCTVKDSAGTEYAVALSPIEATAIEPGSSGQADLVFAVKTDSTGLTLDMTPALTAAIQVVLK